MMILRLFIAYTAFFSMSLLAQEQSYYGTCKVEFFAKTSLQTVHGQVDAKPFAVDFKKTFAAGREMANWKMKLAVQKIETQNPLRNKRVHQIFDYDVFPWIQGEFQNVDVGPFEFRDQRERPMNFLLTIRDKTRDVIATFSHHRETDSVLSFDLDFIVSLKRFRLKSPKHLGFFKADDKIRVHCSFVLEKSSEKIPPRFKLPSRW